MEERHLTWLLSELWGMTRWETAHFNPINPHLSKWFIGSKIISLLSFRLVARNNCKENTTSQRTIILEILCFQVIYTWIPRLFWTIFSPKQWRQTKTQIVESTVIFKWHDTSDCWFGKEAAIMKGFNACLGYCEKAEVSALWMLCALFQHCGIITWVNHSPHLRYQCNYMPETSAIPFLFHSVYPRVHLHDIIPNHIVNQLYLK